MFGRKETVAMSVVNYFDNYRRDAHFYINWLTSSYLRREMSRNKTLKEAHKGERCFIIGNGPSLKHHDLTKLREEHVFSVNLMMKSDCFKTLQPRYHVMMDPILFGLNEEKEGDREKIELIEKTNKTNPDLTYFIPFRRRMNFVKLFPDHKFRFIYNYKMYTSQVKRSSSLHRITPGFQNVIVYAINIAIYMGFKEIYLLGVDMTGFLEHFEYNKVNDQWGHAYSKTEAERNQIKKVLKEQKIDNEFYLKTYGKTFEHLKIMQTHARAKKAKLFNASEHGALDFIPRVDYESLFANKPGEGLNTDHKIAP